MVSADSISDNYYGISLANGSIGLTPWKEPFSVDRVIMNNSFDANDFHGVSRAVRGINPFNIKMEVDGNKVISNEVTQMKQCLDMKRAIFSSSFTIPGKAEVKYDIRALRQLAYTGLIVIEIKALSDITISLKNDFKIPEDEYKNVEQKDINTDIEGVTYLFKKAWGDTKYRNLPVAATTAFINNTDATQICVKLEKGKIFRTALAGSICTGNDFIDPFNEADREVIFVLHQEIDKIISGHERLWNELWQGDIEIVGDYEAQEVIRMRLYHLYSFCPIWSIRSGL